MWEGNVCNRCSRYFHFVIKSYTLETMWKAWLQEKKYKQKYPNYFLLYFAFLNITCICFRPHACAVILRAGVKNKQNKTAWKYGTILQQLFAVRRTRSMSSPYWHLKSLHRKNCGWSCCICLFYNFPRVSMSTHHVLTGVLFWHRIRCNKDW